MCVCVCVCVVYQLVSVAPPIGVVKDSDMWERAVCVCVSVSELCVCV